MAQALIALGGNLGDVERTFDEALRRIELADRCSIASVSTLHRTSPVGDAASTPFLNAAAQVETDLAPVELLERLHAIERELGRTRDVRWGPRSVDLDLLFYGSEIIRLPQLIVPHPAAWYRRFVLDPLVEIAPGFVHPERHADIRTLRERLLPRPLPVALAGGSADVRAGLFSRIGARFSEVHVADWPMVSADAVERSRPVLVFWLGRAANASELPGDDFAQLPVTSRIDVTAASRPTQEFIRHVLESALG